MATNDFVHDLVDKLAEEKVEYLLIAVQKGKKEHKANAYFNITTVDGADMILTTVDQVYASIEEGNQPNELEFGDDDDLEATS